jgi:hypothetical protein
MNKSTLQWIIKNEWVAFDYAMYQKVNVLGTNCLIHKFIEWNGVSKLYPYDNAPNGLQIVCDISNYYKIIEQSNWSPISIQETSPNAPLTSSLFESLKL